MFTHVYLKCYRPKASAAAAIACSKGPSTESFSGCIRNFKITNPGEVELEDRDLAAGFNASEGVNMDQCYDEVKEKTLLLFQVEILISENCESMTIHVLTAYVYTYYNPTEVSGLLYMYMIELVKHLCIYH